jgi:hypothetical protein
MLELEKLKVWIKPCKNLWICYLTLKSTQHMSGLKEKGGENIFPIQTQYRVASKWLMAT